MYYLLKWIPKNHLSYFVGQLARLERPRFLVHLILKWFASKFKVNVSEAELPLNEYHSLSAFFVRELKPGLRPIGEGVVSPVDGSVTEWGDIQDGKLVQVKGKEYSLQDLVRSDQLAAQFQGGTAITFYLAPPDYHHIHSSVDGEVNEFYHIPGQLWPVNAWSVNAIDDLFASNERVVTVMRAGATSLLTIMVGATNVGSIALAFDTHVTNSLHRFLRRGEVLHRSYTQPRRVVKGARLGTFQMGSSVILIFEKGRFIPDERLKLGPIRYGTTIGKIRES